jgi:hypothetical protein
MLLQLPWIQGASKLFSTGFCLPMNDGEEDKQIDEKRAMISAKFLEALNLQKVWVVF